MPRFEEDPNVLGHIFKKTKGHLIDDTPENRKIILEAVANPENWVTKTKFGTDIYVKVLPDGSQAWAHVNKDGIITSGGRNLIPVDWVSDPRNVRGCRPIPKVQYQLRHPDLIDFKITLQSHKLQPRYQEMGQVKSASPGGKVKGVSQEVGIILNMFDRVESIFEIEHLFFLPTPEGLFLSQEELQMIITEMARGIFIYGQIPWFSLFTNRDKSRSPIIHPAYQGTFVGHTIGLLDYYMKYFFEGFFYSTDFVCQWAKNPNMDEAFLSAQLQNFHTYCTEHGQPYRSFKEILMQVKKERYPDAHLKTYDEVSFRIIAKQNSMKYIKNLFGIDGSFDIEYTIRPAPTTEEDRLAYSVQEEACSQMAAQITEIMPKLPLFKKYFQALSVINFLTYYYITLQKAHKIPLIHNKPPHPGLFICPALFPPIPLSMAKKDSIPFPILDLFAKMDPINKSAVFQLIRGNEESLNPDNPSLTYFAHLLHMNTGDWGISCDFAYFLHAATIFFKKYQKMYHDFNQAMEEGLVSFGFKKRGEPTSDRIKTALFEKMQLYVDITSDDIRVTEERISSLQRAGKSLGTLPSELSEHKKSREGFLLHAKMYRFWFDDPIASCAHEKIFVLNPLYNTAGFMNLAPEGKSLITGGCGLKIVDKILGIDSGLLGLLESNAGALSTLPFETLMPVEGGCLFKINFESHALVDSDDIGAAAGLFSYRNFRSLTEKEITILDAVTKGNITVWQTSSLEDWNVIDPQGIPIVHYAARRTNLFFLEFLARKRLRLNIRDLSGFSPFHIAASEGNIAALQFLFDHIPDLINGISENKETPLYIAAQSGHLSCVQFLIERKASVNICTNHGMTPLLVALYQGFEDIALAIASVPESSLQEALTDGTQAIHIAIEKKMERMTRYLLKYSEIRVSRKDGYNPLHLAVENRWLIGARMIMEACPHFNINEKTVTGSTAIRLAILSNQPEFIEFLVTKGAIVPTDLVMEDTASGIVEGYPDREEEKSRSFHEACFDGSLDDVYKFLKDGVDPLSLDSTGLSAFDLAIHEGHTLITEILVAEAEFPKDTKPYISIAAKNGHFNMVVWLIKWGAPIDLPDEYGWTALHYASQKEDKQIISLLLCMGANPEIKTPDHKAIHELATPICAAFIARYEMISPSARSPRELAIKLEDSAALYLCRS
jgi:ankyrin repeat protein